MNQRAANLARLEDQIRTLGWYHDLSEQESDDEVDQMLGDRPRPAPPRCMAMQARVPLRELDQWITQLQNDVQNRGLDNDAFHQRVTKFLA